MRCVTVKISTKGRYGLRAMVDLAVHSKGGHVALNSIAERQDVSGIYLEQVFSTLRKAGLVKSVKGSQGGYVLSDDPSKLTVGAVLRALEGDLSIVDLEEDIKNATQGVRYCIATKVWEKVNECINDVVDSMTLEDLADKHRRLNENQQLMYYI